MSDIKIDLNNPEFQSHLFSLEKIELFALLKALKKISKISWKEFYSDNGFKWEAIKAKHTSSGNRVYSFRFSKKYRATALREENFLRILTLNVDHDSAY